jgi:L-fuconolactonase
LPKVLALAEHQSVNIKISGACTLSHEPFPYSDIWGPPPSVSTAACGATELLTTDQGVAPFRATNRLSDADKARLMGGT